ncbi:MAG: hypothetical protein EXR69_04725 [Myxococcales bacterium]|nr:hypothetical protein [Myxococcales bacterium]
MLPILALLLAVPLGCQAPFVEDRRDLASMRVAGISANTEASGTTRLRAAVWSGLGAWHDVPPDLLWTDATDPAATATGQSAGLEIELPGSVQLTATSADSSAISASESARIDVQSSAVTPTIDGFSRATVNLDISQISDSIADREAVVPGDDAPVPAGGAARLTLGVAEGLTVHWMATGGQFAELDRRTTDWFAGTAVLDRDNEVESTTPAEPGIYTILALAFDGLGNNTWFWLDVAVDVEGPLLYTHGRILVTDSAEPVDGSLQGPFAATVAEADGTAGITLGAISAVNDATGSPELCGNTAGVAFDFGPMAEGWCARADVAGRTVVLDGEIR